jgi:hypothetical protein
MATIRILLASAVLLVAGVGVGVAQADPLGGGKVAHEKVNAHSTDAYIIDLRGKETTRIRLHGDGDTCLELRVYDENGNLVAADTLGFGDDRQLLVRPRWTGPFKIEIKNLGKVYNRYTLILD